MAEESRAISGQRTHADTTNDVSECGHKNAAGKCSIEISANFAGASGQNKNSKKRAVIAVAKKLAVLLHKLWVTAEVYEPLYGIEPMPAI